MPGCGSRTAHTGLQRALSIRGARVEERGCRMADCGWRISALQSADGGLRQGRVADSGARMD
eukprot:11107703-Alexandrium_andersonii.AAC.1